MSYELEPTLELAMAALAADCLAMPGVRAVIGARIIEAKGEAWAHGVGLDEVLDAIIATRPPGGVGGSAE